MTQRQRQLLAAEVVRHLILAQFLEEPKLKRDHEEVAAALSQVLEERKGGEVCHGLERRSGSPRPRSLGKRLPVVKVKKCRSRAR